MSSADEQTQKAGQLIERLLLDAPFRAAFRKDPAGACRELGLGDLAEELDAGGKSMHTLELRESKSSLAGVVMAVAAEGIGVVELHGMIEHGLLKGNLRGAGERALRGVNPMHPGRSLHSELRSENPLSGASRNPLGTAERGAALARGAEQSAGAPSSSSSAAASSGTPGVAASGSSGAGTAATPGASAAGAGAPSGGGSTAAASTGAGGSAATGSAAGGGGAGESSVSGAGAGGADASSVSSAGGTAQGGAQTASSGGGAAPWPTSSPGGGAVQAGAPTAGGGGAGAQAVTPTPGSGGGAVQAGAPTPPPAPPSPGAQPAAGGAVPVWPEPAQAPGGAGAAAVAQVADLPGQGSSGGTASGLAELLDSPHLAMSPGVRAIFAQGGVDPRMVSVLDNAVAHHNIVIGDIETSTEPVHAQAIDIVSVDGQPVGPSNVAARDLITEIAAMEPGARPNEIGTPWPIQSQGFFTNAQHQNRLHLAFTSPGDYQAPPAGAPVAEAGTPPGTPADLGSSAGVISSSGVSSAPGVGSAAEVPGSSVGSSAGVTPTAPGVGSAAEVPGSGVGSSAGVAPTAPAVGSAAEVPGSGVGTTAGVASTSPGGPLSATSSSAAEALSGPQARTGGGAATALAWAHSMLHRLPESEGENVGPALNRFEAQFDFHGAPWCGIFVGHALERAGLKVPDSIASVASILDMAKNGEGPFEKGILPISAIRPGDLVTFGGTEHVAMVVKVDGEGIHTIAGNYENNVTEHTYSAGEVTGAVRPNYSAALPQAQAPGGFAAGGAAPGGASSPPVVPSTEPAPGVAAVAGAAPAAGVAAAGSPGPAVDSAAAATEAPGGAQIAGASPTQPDTAIFKAAAPSSGASHHTVKFLQAIQPSSSSPPPDQAPGGAPTAQQAGAPNTAGAPTAAGTPTATGAPAAGGAPGSASAAEAAPGSGGGVEAVAGALDGASSGTIPYPGDNAPKAEIAQWMGDIAQKHGLPRELPVMASLVESSLHNDAGGDRDSVGYFQMRTGIWDNGEYAGYPSDPALQVKWFIDQAVAVKEQNPSLTADPSRYGEWIDEIERPAAEYRGRYQLQLNAARELLGER